MHGGANVTECGVGFAVEVTFWRRHTPAAGLLLLYLTHRWPPGCRRREDRAHAKIRWPFT